jgi:hypothetical protein
MMISTLGHLAVLDLVVLTMVLSGLGYFARVRLPRPPVGRFNRSDVIIMSCLLVVLPFGYLLVPDEVVSAVFAVMFFAAVQLTLAPLLGGRPAGVIALALVAGTAAAALLGYDAAVLVLNGVLIAVAVVGVTNLWAQTGMTAAHAAALAGVLIGYDLLATGVGSVTARFLAEVTGHPFAPLLAVTAGPAPIGLGLGDCLMLTLWPLVASKAFGKSAGRLGAAVGVVLLVAVQAALLAGIGPATSPFMVVLGPAIVVQYLAWRRIRGAERRTRSWLGVAGPDLDTARRARELRDALRVAGSTTTALPDTWIAIDADTIVGEGPTPGSARRAARLGGCPRVPVVVQYHGGP